MAKCVRDFQYWVEQDTTVRLIYLPGREMHFVPMTLGNYVCDRTPNVSIGAAMTYVWHAAFAKSQSAMALAIRNLVGLLPADAPYFAETFMDEANDAP